MGLGWLMRLFRRRRRTPTPEVVPEAAVPAAIDSPRPPNMIRSPETTAMTPLDVLELDLRRLPNVTYVGFMDRADTLVVQILATGTPDPDRLLAAAEKACFARLDRAFHVELAGGSRRDRIRILAVRVPIGHANGSGAPVGDDVEVHLGFEGVRSIGRAPAGGAEAAARATIDALRGLGATVPFTIEAAALFEHALGRGVMLVLASETEGERYGVAAADTEEVAATRATLHALNRYLSIQNLRSPVR